MRLSWEKGVVNDAGSVNRVTRVQGITEGPACPPTRFAMLEVGIPYCPVPSLASAIQKTYPPPPAPMPSGGVYTYPHMPSPVISSPPISQAEVNPAFHSISTWTEFWGTEKATKKENYQD